MKIKVHRNETKNIDTDHFQYPLYIIKKIKVIIIIQFKGDFYNFIILTLCRNLFTVF